jgi:hypothetical protein
VTDSFDYQRLLWSTGFSLFGGDQQGLLPHATGGSSSLSGGAEVVLDPEQQQDAAHEAAEKEAQVQEDPQRTEFIALVSRAFIDPRLPTWLKKLLTTGLFFYLLYFILNVLKYKFISNQLFFII